MFFLHLVVFLLVEPVVDGYSWAVAHDSIIHGIKQSQVHHLTVEIPSVELYAQDRLIQVLELRHGEHLWQQFKPDWLEMDFLF